MEVVLALCQYC